MHDHDDDIGNLCTVCRQPTAAGPVCPADRDAIARQLHGLITQVQRLQAELVPGARRGDGQPAPPKAPEAGTPARLDALSLLGPGTVAVTAMLHPQIRHWRTVEDIDVQALHTVRKTVAGRDVETRALITERRTITVWHQELARDPVTGQPILAADDDQIGALPPREWLASWADVWQDALHNHGPAAVTYTGPRTRAGGSPARTAALHQLAADPATSVVLAAVAAVRVQYDAAVQATLAGHTYGFAGDTSRWSRTDDPLVDDLEARYGTATTATAVARLVTYLLLWLDEACLHPDIPIRDFAGELRAMSAELARVLGDQPAQLWLGRCPARLTTPGDDTGPSRPCGAGIWQDPHSSQVQCPRCHSTWGPRRSDLLRLAYDMRATWPVDRRRRYTDEERTHTRQPKCPTCGQPATVTWRDVTGTTDQWRTWQPVGATCPNGCPETREAI